MNRRQREDEKALWKLAMQGVKPLRKPRAAAPAAAKPTAEAARKFSPPIHTPKPATPAGRPARELAHGERIGLDRRSAERLSRGELRIDGRLDLHGLTQAAAAERLASFLARAQHEGKRCVLVITGKGGREGAGVLREQVPRWLNHAPNRERVLAFDYAQPKHGAEGALYVLLKRRRDL